MKKPFKLKKLNIKKIDKIFSKLEKTGNVRDTAFAKLRSDRFPLSDFITVTYINEKQTLNVSVCTFNIKELTAIPVTLVKGDVDSYNKFLEYWELFRKDIKVKIHDGVLEPIIHMIEMNTENFNKLIELINLDLHITARAFLVGSKLKYGKYYKISLCNYGGGRYELIVYLVSITSSSVRFNIDIKNPKEFIGKWNELRNKFL